MHRAGPACGYSNTPSLSCTPAFQSSCNVLFSQLWPQPTTWSGGSWVFHPFVDMRAWQGWGSVLGGGRRHHVHNSPHHGVSQENCSLIGMLATWDASASVAMIQFCPMPTDLIFNHIFSLFLSQDLIKYKSDHAGGTFALFKPLCRCAQCNGHVLYQARVICHRQKVRLTSFLKQGWGQGTQDHWFFLINIVHLPNSWTPESTRAVFCLELWNRNLSGNQYGVCLKIDGSRPGIQYPGPDEHMV